MTDTPIAQRYMPKEELGKGGMGTVYRGVDSHTGQTVAIKHLNPKQADPQLIERFQREGEALRELNHPNIVTMLDAVEDNGQHYLIMEYLPGGDLQTVIHAQHDTPLPVDRILKIAIEIGDALTRAHHLNIIHRDLKPANVLLAEDGTPRLTDFGVAHAIDKERITQTDAIIGTLDCMPPEALNGEPIDNRADIWAFGVLLFEMLTREKPFKGDTLSAVITAILTQPVPDLESLRPDAPVALVDLVYRMLIKDRHARVRSIRQVGLELEDILHRRESNPPPTRFEPPSDTDTLVFERPRHNLPAQTTPFVGREVELGELAKHLTNPSIRLVTIVAPGGMGKTRLALEMAQRAVSSLQGSFRDGVYFVELAPLSDPANIVSAIADVIGYQFQGDGRDQKQQLLDFLTNKEMLLVLDNFEHLLDGARLVTDILRAAPQMQILVTSRQRLSQSGETVFNLSGMEFQDWETPAEALEHAAMQLFMQGAERTAPDFELTTDNMNDIAQICKLVQGMPLGILLAASWVSMLSPDEIGAEIGQGIDFLASDMTDLPERHRSIHAVFDYTWALMSETEQQVFMRLSVLRGGFTREAAQAIGGANLRTLMRLINKSLILRNNDTGRYEMHELLRQYGEFQLEQSEALDDTRNSHSRYYARFIREREIDIKGRRQLQGLNDIETDYENIKLAWGHALEHGLTDELEDMIEGLYWFCTFRSRPQEGYALFQQGAERLGQQEATLHLASYLLAYFPEQLSNPVEELQHALHLAQEHNDLPRTALALRQLGLYYGHRMEYDPESVEKGMHLLQESLDIYQQLDDRFYMAHLLDEIGWCYEVLGRIEERHNIVRQCIALRREIGDKIGVGNALRGYATLQLGQNQYSESMSNVQEAYTIALEMNDVANMAWSKSMMGLEQVLYADFADAVANLKETLLLASDNHLIQLEKDIKLLLSLIASIQEDYETGLSYLDDVRESASEAVDVPLLILLESLATGVLSAASKDHEQLQTALSRGLTVVTSAFQRSFKTWYLPLAAVLLAAQGHPKRAVEVLSLAFNHPQRNTAWAEQWAFLNQMRTQWKAQLGDAAYNTAWERGRRLDLESVVQQLLAEFGVDKSA